MARKLETTEVAEKELVELSGEQNTSPRQSVAVPNSESRVQLIDRNTERPVANTELLWRIESEPEQGELLSATTDSEGWVALPSDARSVSPADGYSFAALPLECFAPRIDGSSMPEELFVDGQFRFRVHGSAGVRCYRANERSGEEWLSLLESEEVAAAPGLRDLGLVDSREWQLSSTQKESFSFLAPGARVSPGHKFWAGHVTDHEDGTETVQFPAGHGPASVSKVFLPKAGDELELTLEWLLPASTIRIETGRNEWSWSRVSLLEIASVEGSHARIRRQMRSRAFAQTSQTAEFTDVPEGEYEVTCAMLTGGVLHVSTQRVQADGGTIFLAEESGLGGHEVHIDCPRGQWFLHSVSSKPEAGGGVNVPVRLDLAKIDVIRGLIHASCDLWISEGPSGETTQLTLDLTRGQLLSQIP